MKSFTKLLLTFAIFPVFFNDVLSQDRPIQIGDEVDVSISSRYTSHKSSSGFSFEKEFFSEGSAYIKIHFDKFDLKEGDYVEILNNETGESIRYENQGKLIKNGEEYLSEFWSQALLTDRVTVRFFASGSGSHYGFDINKVAYGYSEAYIESVLLRKVCGKDDKQPVICYDGTILYEKSKAVCKLLIGGSTLCTGWLLGSEGHIMTNNHCISSSNGAYNVDFQFNYQRSSCNGSSNSSIDIVAETSTLICTNRSLDYTLLKLPNNPTSKYGYLSFRNTQPEIGERIYIPQHPGGKRKEVSVNDDQSSTGKANVRTNGNRVSYLCDTEGGSSGSPVLSYQDNLVIALHNSGSCSSNVGNGGTRNTNIIDHMGSCMPKDAVVDINSGPPVAAFSFNASSSNCLNIHFTSRTTGDPVSWSWDFGDGNSSSQENPSHTYSAPGIYIVKLRASNAKGTDNEANTVSINEIPSPTGRDVDICPGETANLKANGLSEIQWYGSEDGNDLLKKGSTFITPVLSKTTTYYAKASGVCGSADRTPIKVNILKIESPSSPTGDEVCLNESANLSAHSANGLKWFDSSNGGNVVGDGTSFTTPILGGTTSYYVSSLVEVGQTDFVGPKDNAFGGGTYSNIDRSLIFDVLEPIVWKSAWVNSGSSRERTIEVSRNGSIIITKTISIPEGKGRINLNIPLAKGTGYHVRITDQIKDLFRNNSQVSYPYKSDFINITTSTASTPDTFYYYLYDWEVESIKECYSSPRIEVIANVHSEPIKPMVVLGLENLKASITADSYQWYLNGQPINGATAKSHKPIFNGNYKVEITDSNGCKSLSEAYNYSINSIDNSVVNKIDVKIYPNPGNDEFHLLMNGINGDVKLKMVNPLGQTVMMESFQVQNKLNKKINIRPIPNGVYYLIVNHNNEQLTKTVKVKH